MAGFNQAPALVERSSRLELAAPVPLNVVCFRFVADADDEQLDRVNREVLVRMQERGTYVLSSATLQRRFALRAAIVKHRTRTADLAGLIEEVENVGECVLAGSRRAAITGTV